MATTMSAPVDVLAALSRIAKNNDAFASTASADDGYIVRVAQSMLEKQAADLREARAAVAELIEADKEYDAARTAVETRDPWSKKLADVSAVLDRLDYAKERRAAALARVGAA